MVDLVAKLVVGVFVGFALYRALRAPEADAADPAERDARGAPRRGR